MKSIRGRIIFDLLLTLVLVFEVLHQITGNVLHEIVGAAFFVCIVLHLSFSANWIRKVVSTKKTGELARQQRRHVVVAILLAIDFIVLMLSSAFISELLWSAGIDLTGFNPGKIWYPVHTVAAYVLCILVLVHLSMHWTTVANTLSVPYDPSRREAISQALNGFVMIGGIALGITGVARAGFQASDFVVNTAGEDEKKTVESGYREVNAQTGEYTTNHSFEAASISDDDGSTKEALDKGTESTEPTCPICPRKCKLSSPRCNRPYEQGLI